MLVCLLLLAAVANQVFAQGMVKRFDAGLSVGTVAFSDAAGYSGALETRAYLAEPVI
jgi:hypothetical protein